MFVLFRILQIALGSFFIFSALVKLFPAEPFELYLFSFPGLTWNTAIVGARLLVVWELLLGLFLLFHWKSKLILKLTTLTLLAFSIVLIFSVLKGEEGSCFCLGAYMEMTPLESLLKNVILLSLVFVLFKQSYSWLKLKKAILIIGVVLVSAVPFILSPPDAWISHTYNYDKEGSLFNVALIDSLDKEDQFQVLHKDRKVIACYSATCQFCKLAANKMNIIDDKYGIGSFYGVVFWGTDSLVNAFWENSESKPFQHIIVDPMTFFKISDKDLPSIYLIVGDSIVKRLGYRDLDESQIIEFLNQD